MASGASKKRISQETFDAAVEENMDAFEMEREEAVADAIAQFEMEGVDLSNIVKSGTVTEDGEKADASSHPVMVVLKEVKEGMSESKGSETVGAVLEGVAKLAELAADEENRALAGGNGAMVMLTSLCLTFEESPKELRVVLDCVRQLCTKNDENRMSLGPVHKAVLTMVSADHSTEEGYAHAKCGLLTAATIMIKQERHKSTFFKAGLHKKAASFIESNKDKPDGLRAAMGVLRSISLNDDRKAQMSKAFDVAREVAATGVLETLLPLIKAHEESVPFVSDALTTIKVLGVNKDITESIMKLEGVEIITSVTATKLAESRVAKAALLALRALAGSDLNKKHIVHGNDKATLRVILEAITTHVDDPTVVEQGCAVLAALTLRMPENAMTIAELGGTTLIVNVLRKAPDHAGVQRHGAHAVRNIVSRSPDLRKPLLEEGVEPLLRAAKDKHPAAADTCYAALRDLDCVFAETEAGKAAHGGDGAMPSMREEKKE